jgi:hypothetical protein
MDEDTDVLLVLLETSLPSRLVAKEELLEALISSGGNVELAARTLNDAFQGNVNASPPQKLNSKRKAGIGLDDWLRSSKRRLIPEDPQCEDDAFRGLPPDNHLVGSSTVSTVSTVGQNSANIRPPLTHPSSLAVILKDKSPRKTHTVQRLPVLTLSTPEAVAKHTPTTLHTSILPAG